MLGLKLLRAWSLIVKHIPFFKKHSHHHEHHACTSNNHSKGHTHHKNAVNKNINHIGPERSKRSIPQKPHDEFIDKCDCHEDHMQGRIKSFFVHLRKFPLWAASIFGAILFGILEVPGDTFLISPSVLFLISLKTPVLMIGFYMFIFGLSKGAIIIPFLVSIGLIRRVIGSKVWEGSVKKITTILGFFLILWGVYLIWLYTL